jgi:hypothetical protein
VKIDWVNRLIEDNLGLDALLVRPDGIVTWVAETEPNLKTAKAALAACNDDN